MSMQDLSDEELGALITDAQKEQQRRQRLAFLPQQVAGLAAQYEADGGSRAVLAEAINNPTPVEEQVQ